MTLARAEKCDGERPEGCRCEEVATQAPDTLATAPRRHGFRRAAIKSATRAMLTTTVLIYLYFVVPFSRTPTASGALWLALGLVAFLSLLSWQLITVTRAPDPRLRAIEVLGTAAPLFLLVFASAYYLMAQANGASFSQPLSRMDALYFAVTVFTTVGFGDIVAHSESARIFVTVQMIGDLIVLGIGARLLLGAVRVGLSRHEEQAPREPPEAGGDVVQQRAPDESRRGAGLDAGGSPLRDDAGRSA